MKSKPQFFRVASGLLLGAGMCATAGAQTADALINKLVEKGILTTKEAGDLRVEATHDSSAASVPKSSLPDWVSGVKMNSDFRARFEENNAQDADYHARDRYRYRLRLGAVVSLQDNFEIGVRLASGNPQTNPGGTLVGGQPITANQDFNSLETRKFIWIDAAYARWTAIKTTELTVSATVGKMDNPFALSNMIYDYDIDPEGAAIQLTHALNSQHTLKLSNAFFALDEINQTAGGGAGVSPISAGHDPYLYGSQLLLESKWVPQFETTVGVAAFDIAHKDALRANVQPFYNSGNTRDPVTDALKYNFNPIVGSAAAIYKLASAPCYPGEFPLKVTGEYMDNPGAPAKNRAYRAGATIGKAGKKGAWEINYRYQRLEADAWFDALEDDDNGAFYATGNPQLVGTGKANGWFGGTNVKGHLVQAAYSFTDFLNFTLTYYLNDLIVNVPNAPSSAGHFMLDLNWKF